MPPGEQPNRPMGRKPMPRHRVSVDGVSGVPPRRPVGMPPAPVQRPIVANRPSFNDFTPTPRPAPIAAPEDMSEMQIPDDINDDFAEQITPIAPAAPVAENVPEPQLLIPQPEAPAEQPAQVPTQVMPPIQPVPSVVPVAEAETKPDLGSVSDPEPKPKKQRDPRKRKKLLKIMAIVLAVAAVAGGGFFAWQWYQARNDPSRAFDDALLGVMSVTKLQSNTISKQRSMIVTYDVTKPKQPITSSQGSATINGATYTINTYGTAKDTYLSYSKLPAGVNQLLANNGQNSWFQIRSKGVRPPGVDFQLVGLTDPRDQLVGPVIVGNFDEQTSNQLLSFMKKNKVYNFSPLAVTKTEVNGQKAFVYNAKIDSSYLKISHQSAALNSGFSPADLQAAVAKLDQLKGTTMKLYVSVKGHNLIRVETAQDGGTTVDYSQFDTAVTEAEPQTKQLWADFAPKQWQIEAQAASQLPPAERDAMRKADIDALKGILTTHYAQTASYPSFNNLNDQAWVAQNITGTDAGLFRDPDGTSLQLTPNPKAAQYAYAPVGANPARACENTAVIPCVNYRLVAVLSNGQQYIVTGQ